MGGGLEVGRNPIRTAPTLHDPLVQIETTSRPRARSLRQMELLGRLLCCSASPVRTTTRYLSYPRREYALFDLQASSTHLPFRLRLEQAVL